MAKTNIVRRLPPQIDHITQVDMQIKIRGGYSFYQPFKRRGDPQ